MREFLVGALLIALGAIAVLGLLMQLLDAVLERWPRRCLEARSTAA